MKPKLFTLEKAHRALPLVRRIVADIRGRYGELIDRKRALVEIAQRQHSAPSDDAVREIHALRLELQGMVQEVNEYIQELHALGVELKDPQTGLVDFYYRHQDRLIYLCWRYDEETIGYWHELDAGFAGRKPISEIQSDTPSHSGQK
ncbi:MAG: DUF2203 domain-containing protein [Planctomycetes bacterium]|nr:DUF2203 domain-containing protein [Planctomycetota bacterium]